MEYYAPADRYPMGPEVALVEEPSDIGTIDRGFRPGGGGYGRPGYFDDAYERPVRYEYTPDGYDQEHYPSQPQQQMMVPAPVPYAEPDSSDLGTGLRDSNFDNERRITNRGAGHGISKLAELAAGYGRGAPGHDGAEHNHKQEKEMKKMKKELEKEKRRKHQFELATAAALGYALHERHEKNDAEEEVEKFEKGKKDKKEKDHRFFTSEGWF